jgi:aromatic-amino-acid transaminase
MFEALKPQPADKILALIQMFRDDPRTEKIDLGVGVYKNAEGLTPVMRAVKAAEKALWETETTKTYTGPTGEPAFAEALAALILGADFPRARWAAAAQVGGTGAVRQAMELVKLASPGATLWLSNPTWPNHNSIAKAVGLPIAEYRYFDEAARGVDFAGMLADLARAKRGDAVVLHGCCHNPTGANLTLAEWEEVAAFLSHTGATALIDLAYQGFGDGLEADALPTRLLANRLTELLVAASCSKNFGIYRERTGLLLAVTEGREHSALAQANLATLNRVNFSFPPDHGARLVTMILTDPALRAEWEAELEATRKIMLGLREKLAAELKRLTNSDRFDFIACHRGMFSRLGASPAQVEKMRAEQGIYMVGDSRLNIAGLNERTVPILACAIVAAGV